MDKEISIMAQHKNCFGTYLSDWMMMIKMIKPQGSNRYDLNRVPTTFEALHNNTYDLSAVLAHLDSRFLSLENNPINQMDLLSYAEARVFLKAFYVFFHILLDNVSGIIEFLYNKNQPGEAVSNKFNHLIKNSERGILLHNLRKILEETSSWVPEITATRDDLVHHYDSLLISIDVVEGSNNILGYFNTKGRASRGNISIRAHLGIILCKYQTLIDNLIDHFDEKFRDWHGIQLNKSIRNLTIMQGCVAYPLWWAYEYGNYRHEDLQIVKMINKG